MRQHEYDVAVTFKLRVKANSAWDAAAHCDDFRLKDPNTAETLVPYKTSARSVRRGTQESSVIRKIEVGGDDDRN